LLLLWINGERVQAVGERVAEVTNPASGRVIRRLPLAATADVDAAVVAARAAFPGWRASTPVRRSRILTRFRELMEHQRDELARLVCEEHGKTLADAAGSVQRGTSMKPAPATASAYKRWVARRTTPW
jgi:malonate-semialdehyde dehydrogenase (acetylating)/methylmalonate-semialdehyde dehydrogenase